MKTTSSPQPNRSILLALSGSALLAIAVFGVLISSTMTAKADTKSVPGQQAPQVAPSSETGTPPSVAKKMKLGIVIYSTDAETVWNAFRFGSFALKQGDSVRIFLLAKGVDCEKLDTKDFKITEQMQAFVDAGGKIQACGTCLTLRKSEGTELCPFSTMKDMHDIVRESDKVLTF
jgi:uncharacterized protein involved in oxidation of intracellular sulfur